MAYTIRANNIDYEVRVHAADNMRKRFISAALVIKTLEEGLSSIRRMVRSCMNCNTLMRIFKPSSRFKLS
ncbi:MAG: hypothetical protein K8I30_01910 [Anaerolineae bacterium]|nr:hypothetical protein [Anaerolineae bacterium]